MYKPTSLKYVFEFENSNISTFKPVWWIDVYSNGKSTSSVFTSPLKWSFRSDQPSTQDNHPTWRHFQCENKIPKILDVPDLSLTTFVKERHCIFDAFPTFIDYVKSNQTLYQDWYKCPEASGKHTTPILLDVSNQSWNI